MQLMRTLGPGSISSLLKIILDVVYVALWIGIGAVGLGALSALLLSFDPDLLGSFTMNFNGDKLVRKWPAIIALLITVSFYLAGILVIVSRLRRIFATLMAGDPFQPENVSRLRVIGQTAEINTSLYLDPAAAPAAAANIGIKHMYNPM